VINKFYMINERIRENESNPSDKAGIENSYLIEMKLIKN